MAERPEQHTRASDAARAEEVVNADGSSAKASTQDGRFTPDDVDNAPLVQGTDPLSDDAIDARRGGRSVTPQLVVFALLGLVFAYFFVSDLVNASWGKAALGALVLAICGFAIARELRGKR